jgi:hypothetical protein
MERCEASDSSSTRDQIGADLIVPLLALGLTGYYLGSTANLTWEARSTGLIVGLVLALLCLLQIGRIAWLRLSGHAGLGTGALFANDDNNRKRAALMLLLALFVAAMPWVGVTVGLFVVLIAGMAVLGVRRPAQILGIAGSTAAIVFLLFIVLLGSRLPRGPAEGVLLRLLAGGGG